MNTINVTKASGEQEPYEEIKLRNSLAAAGAGQEVIEEITSSVRDMLYEGISTRKVYNEAFRLLRQRSDPSAGRYKLKEAIFELGPTGYPFEKFISELLSRLGYSTEVGQVIQGKCVSHEIDVIAENDNSLFIVECKFHNRKNHKCNVQVPLYIQARFEDVERNWRHQAGRKKKEHHGWVVTNTRFTDDATEYANCMGLKLLSWDYPRDYGLKDLISRVNLHPVTCLSTLNGSQKRKLLEHDIIFGKQLFENKSVPAILDLDMRKMNTILREAGDICGIETSKR